MPIALEPHQIVYCHDQLLIIIPSSGMLAMLGIGSGPVVGRFGLPGDKDEQVNVV
jgi:hypothetical protein